MKTRLEMLDITKEGEEPGALESHDTAVEVDATINGIQ